MVKIENASIWSTSTMFEVLFFLIVSKTKFNEYKKNKWEKKERLN